jgi:LPXTG-motif cell wall-anchored protein
MQHEQGQDFSTDALFLMEATKANSVLEAIYLRLQNADSAALHNPPAVQLIERLRVQERILQNLQRDQSDVDEIRRGEKVINQLKLQLAEIRTDALPNFSTYAQILDTQIADRSINASRIILDSTAVFIEYFLQNDRGYAVVVRDAEVSFIALRDVMEISTKTRDLLEMLHSRTALQGSPEEFGRHAYWLYERLILDVIEDTGGLTALIIVPDGILNYLPFEVLLSRWDSTMSYAQMPFLIRDVAIHYAYSAGVLSLQDRIKSPFEKGIAFAPFDQDHRGFAGLTYSTEEIANARKRMGLQAYAGRAASFDKFIALAAESRIIHLATHAGIDSMGEGRIEFADSSMWLTDIYYLPLQCDLAILSACESAFGENTPSEGIQNFARAFALAGTRTILASHWKLNDAAAAMIIGSFYQHLQQGHPISSALRHAKLDYLTDSDIPAMRKSPHYWATFVMVGSDDYVAVRRTATVWYVAFGMMILIAGGVLYYRRRKRRKPR